jgi:site-specific recombinase XerD
MERRCEYEGSYNDIVERNKFKEVKDMMSEPRVKERERLAWCYSFKASKLWFTSLHSEKSGSKHTEREYSRGLKAFCDWIEKTPDQLIAERKAELKNEETERNAENKLSEFCVMLENKHTVTRSTIATKFFAPVKSFYSYNYVPLKLRTPKHTTQEREPHTVEQIRALMKIVDVRERAFMMLLKDSGMSREDAVTLRYGDIKAEYEAGKEVIHIKAVRQKESIEYDTFIGKNAIESLKAYLEYRQRRGETITDSTPIISQLNGKALTPESFSMIFDRLSDKAGFKTSPHRFRKFFESHLGLSAPSILVKSWMGHSLGVEGHYFMPPLEKQREKYAECYHEIDLSEKPTLSELKVKQMIALETLKQTVPSERYAELEKLVLQTQSTKELDDLGSNVRSGKIQLEPVGHEDCQFVITESELENYIARGFRFLAVLPSGKVVVSNET